MEFLVHGNGFAETMQANSPAQAVADFRRLAQEVNPDLDLYAMEFDVEPVSYQDSLWESEARNQHLMTYGYCDW